MSANGLMDIRQVSGATIVGHVGEFRSDPIALLRRINEECGPLGRFRLLTLNAVIANAPEHVAEVLVEKARLFRKSRLIRTALYPLAGEGLFTSEGDLWRRQRKLMAPLFQPGRIASYAPSMVEAAVRCIGTWRDGQELDVAHETTRIAMSVAGKALFDTDTFDETDAIGGALTEALHWATGAPESPAIMMQIIVAGLLERALPLLPGAVRPT